MSGHCNLAVFKLITNPNMSAFIETGDAPKQSERVSVSSCGDRGGTKRKASSPERQTSRKSSEESPKKRRRSKEGASREEFEAKYQQLNPLGAGSFGAVFAGYRREDGFPVAIKHIPRKNVMCEGAKQKSRALPLEVEIMMKVAHGQEMEKSNIICLLDFYDLHQELILVMERPVPALDLFDHIENRGGVLQEEESRIIVKQLVQAGLELQSKKVFHRDIKVENILIQTSSDVPRVKLIDFGLSCYIKKSSTFRNFHGTSAHIPPEWYQSHTYRPGPTSVWQIGIALYDMLHGETRFDTQSYLSKDITISRNLSPQCQEVLNLLLTEDPHQRPTLDQLSCHPWRPKLE